MEKYDINKDLFRRFSAENKIKIVKSFTTKDLLSINKDTILRMLKEAGKGSSSKKRSKFKKLNLIGATNEWNSKVREIYNGKNDEIWLSVYIQGDDTDTEVGYKLVEFLDNRYEEQVLGQLKESFRDGYSHTISAVYDRENRANVVKAICLSYINNKYNVKK